jgi:F-type H+-transporting ATPase subunit b
MAGEASYGAEHASGGAGLPQLDPSLFPSQIFWLAVFFTLLYVILDRALLPKLSGVIETRAQKIKSDIDAAAKANAEAQAALSGYDQAVATARAESRQRLDEARAEANDMRTKQTAEAEAAMTQRLNAADERLSGQRASGLAAARAAAEDVAQEIVARLTGARAA